MILRRYTRISVNFWASFVGDATGHGLVTDLSLFGCCLRRKESLAVGKAFTLLLHFHAAEPASRVEHAVVRWQTAAEHHGIEFIVMSE